MSSVFTTSSSLVSDSYGTEELDDVASHDDAAAMQTTHGPGRGSPATFRGGRMASTERSTAMVRFSRSLHGKHVSVAASGLSATRAPDTWSHGLVCAVDADPLVPGRSVLVRLHQHPGDKPQALVGGLCVAAVDDCNRLVQLRSQSDGENRPDNSKDKLPAYLCPELEKSLVTGVWTECMSNDMLTDGCRLWICYGYDGNLHYFINNNYCGRLFAHYNDNIVASNNSSQYLSISQYFHRKIALANEGGRRSGILRRPPVKHELWLVFDLYGSTRGIEIIATADGITSPPEVYLGGYDSMRAYAAACQASGVLPESDVPVIFIGPAQSGKTTICNALHSGVSLSHSLLEGTPFAATGGGLLKIAEQNAAAGDALNNLSGSLNLQDSEQWTGSYLCSELAVRQRPKRKANAQGAFLGGPKASDHLLRMSVSAAQNLVLQALTQYEISRSAPQSPVDKVIAMSDDFPTTPLPMPSSPRLPSFLPPSTVATTPNDLILLAQTMFDEIVMADESGNGGTTGVVPHASLVRSPSRTSTSSLRRRAGCAGLSYRLCDHAVKAPVSYWLAPVVLLPKALYVMAFDLSRIETNTVLINDFAHKKNVNTTAASMTAYLDELAIWLELIYLRHSETNHFSPWSVPATNNDQNDDIFDPNGNESFLPSIVLVGTRADRVATSQPTETLRIISNKLKYVADWFSGRPFFRHVVGLTALVPTMTLPSTITTSLHTISSIIPRSSLPSICSISSLRRSLEIMARQQPSTKSFVPKRWVDLDATVVDLATSGLTFLTTEQLRTLASDSSVLSESELVAFVRYAHGMGRLFHATASMGIGLQDNVVSDGIVFVHPHNLADLLLSSLVNLCRSHEQDPQFAGNSSDSLPPLMPEDRLHAAFQRQSQQREDQINMANSRSAKHQQLRWVSWLLNKLDIATPWLLKPDESSFQRKYVLLPLIPQKPTSSQTYDVFANANSADSSLFTFYISFKSAASDFVYILFLCRCLRWAFSRTQQQQQQQHQQQALSSHLDSPLLEQKSFFADSWPHQLSRSVSYIRIDEHSPSAKRPSSLAIVITNQIVPYNRIKISMRPLSNKTHEEPASTLKSAGTRCDAVSFRGRAFSDSQHDTETEAVNHQIVLAVLNDLRKCVLRAVGDLQMSMFRRLSFQLSVACPCTVSKCALHDKVQCQQDTCVHLISLSECLTNACVTCEFEGRTNTTSIRGWFPSVAMPTCAVNDESDQTPVLTESVLVDTFDNIEFHKGSLIPQWLKTAAKLMNADDANVNGDSDRDDSDDDDARTWVELGRQLGYNETAVFRFGEDVNSSLALLCDWIITAGNNQLAVDVLLSYLEQMGRNDIVAAIRTGRRTPKTVQVFISYQYDTQADVRALCEWLQFRGYTYWLDDAQISGGDQLAVEIERAIRNCRVFLACLSPRYLVSQHCHREIWLADLLNKPIVPVVFEKIPWPPPGPLGLVLARLVYVDMKGVGGHGGGGLEADFLGRLTQVIDIVAGYMPNSASPKGRAHTQAHSGMLSVMRARNSRTTAGHLSARSEDSRSHLISGLDGHRSHGGSVMAVRVQSCTGCSVM